MVFLPSCRDAFLASVLLLVWLSEARGDCGPPQAIPNTEVKDSLKQSYPVGARVVYTCISGYEPSSSRPRVTECLPNSEWSEVSVSCRGRQCPVPNIENGRIIEESDLRLGAEITFACDEGHRVVGRNGARCIVQSNKMVWNNAPPLCERIPCLPPPEIANGNHNGQGNYVYGSAVTYRCDRPFSLIGSQSILCESDQALNGKWSARAPECKVVSCRTPEVPNGIMRTSYRPSYTYQDRIRFACKPGFKLKDNRGDSSCGADSTWQPSLPECVLDGTLLPSSGPNVTSVFGSQAPPVTVPIYTGALPTLQTELNWEKLFIILQEIKDTVNIKTKSLEERLDGLEKKVDKTIYELKSCCQQANEGLEEEDAQ